MKKRIVYYKITSLSPLYIQRAMEELDVRYGIYNGSYAIAICIDTVNDKFELINYEHIMNGPLMQTGANGVIEKLMDTGDTEEEKLEAEDWLDRWQGEVFCVDNVFVKQEPIETFVDNDEKESQYVVQEPV